jgi:sucrose-6-phosphate hydrolase SacC (GH32 family)
MKRREFLGAVAEGQPGQRGRIRLRILVDRSSVEVFGNDGEIIMPSCFLAIHPVRSLWR